MQIETKQDHEQAGFERDLGINPKSLPYNLLFARAGIDPSVAISIIPFLKSSTEFLSIPGRSIRINNLDGQLLSLNDEDLLKHMIQMYKAMLPEIPLRAMDLRSGIPANFRDNNKIADFFVVNSGVIVRSLDISPEAGVTYLKSITYATRPGSLLMIINKSAYGEIEVSTMAEIIGAKPFNDKISDRESGLLKANGLSPRKLMCQDHEIGQHLGDFIELPECSNDCEVNFFTKI